MKLPTSISLNHEPWLERWARLLRFEQTKPVIAQALQKLSSITVLDYGCGQDTLYYNYLAHEFPNDLPRIHYVGVDPLLDVEHPSSHFAHKPTLIASRFEDLKLSLKADVIVMLAVIEHVDNPYQLVAEAVQHLNGSGSILITTPSPLAKSVLEFFSYTAGIISKREIDEHKRYPDKDYLLQLGEQIQKKTKRSLKMTHCYFEFGLNNFLQITAV